MDIQINLKKKGSTGADIVRKARLPGGGELWQVSRKSAGKDKKATHKLNKCPARVGHRKRWTAMGGNVSGGDGMGAVAGRLKDGDYSPRVSSRYKTMHFSLPLRDMGTVT